MSQYEKFHCQHKGTGKLVILVHGLTGRMRDSWGNMPDYICQNTDYDVFLIGYRSTLFLTSPSVETVGRYILTQIRNRTQIYEHIVLVGHSLGCLAIQSAVIQGLEDKQSDIAKVKNIVLYAPPLAGSDLATMASVLPIPFISRQVHQLRSSDDWLLALQSEWIHNVYRPDANRVPHGNHIPTTIVIGNDDTIVPPARAIFVYRDPSPQSVQGNHFTCKLPESKDDIRFVVLRNVLLPVLSNKTRAFYVNLIEEMVTSCHLNGWRSWTDVVLDHVPSWEREVAEGIERFHGRIELVDWPHVLVDLEIALQNLSGALFEAVQRFRRHAVLRGDLLEAVQFYKDYKGYPDAYDRALLEFNYWVAECHRLVLEGAKSANWLAEITRREISPNILPNTGTFSVQFIPLGPEKEILFVKDLPIDDSGQFEGVLTYSEEEKSAITKFLVDSSRKRFL